ncbi:MAG TPA: hypothetical protein PLC07_06505 [Bacillota bacterium]|mgnify:CR=1 FL=1|nr:hypothetical protein [Bacillota bacterium]
MIRPNYSETIVGVIFLFRRYIIFTFVLIVALFLVVPIGADPSDVVLDQEVQLEVPGAFKTVDADGNGKAEAIEFTIAIKSYREGNFTLTATLEAQEGADWVPIATTVDSFKWTAKNNVAKVVFYPSKLIEKKLNGPYRVSVALKEGNWGLPEQVAGFTEQYTWQMFEDKGVMDETAIGIASSADAKRAAEMWASLNKIELGEFVGVSYDYDTWQVDFKPKRWNGWLYRFLVHADGQVRFLRLNPKG